MWATSTAVAVVTVLAIGLNHSHPAPPQAAPRVGTIDIRKIPENSGIVVSRRYPGVYWTHSDSGNEPLLHAISREGRLLATFRLDVANHDWEDIAASADGHLYIADTGNNHGKRHEVNVIEVDEPDPSRGSQMIHADHNWRLTYPEDPFNCEAMFVHEGQGYLISKRLGGQPASVYRFDLSSEGQPVMLQTFLTLPPCGPVTAADITADGRRIAVLSSTELDIYEVDGNVERLGQVEPFRQPLMRPNTLEGCCFTADGVLVTAETGEMYLFPSSRTTLPGSRH